MQIVILNANDMQTSLIDSANYIRKNDPNKLVSVVVPVFNSSKTMLPLLTSLSDQSFPKDKYEIIIVDDSSTDNTIEIVMSFVKRLSQPRIKIIRLDSNVGPAAARNRGIMEAEGDIICFIDSDTIPDKEWLKELVHAFNDENVGGSRGTTLTYGYMLFPIRVAPVGGGFLTCNIAYRKNVLLRVGLFDERFKRPFAEDGDLAHRILKAGFKIVDSPKAIVIHPVKSLNFKQIVYMAKLRQYDVLFFRKHPIEAKTYGERFMRPRFVVPPFLGLSLTGMALLSCIIAVFILTMFSRANYFLEDLLIVLGFILPIFILFFTLFGYRAVLYGDPPTQLPFIIRLKCAIAILIFYLIEIASRIYGSIKYRVLFI